MSFRSQLNLLFIVLIFSIGLSSLWVQHNQQQKVIEISLQEQANSISILIAEDFARIIYLNEASSASNITSQLKKITTLKSAKLYDTDGKRLLMLSEKTIKENTFGTYTIHSKLLYQGVNLGNVKFIFYSKKLANESKLSKTFSILSIVLLYIFAIILGYFIDKRFIGRLSDLSFALQKTATTKDFSIRLNPSSTDEIGQAQNNFNKLVGMVESKTSELRYRATHDSLTGLYSRESLLEEIEQSLTDIPKQLHALCYIDLDQFKVVNDTCGHKAGDLLLIQLSSEMRELLEIYPDTMIGRIGGDEFILLIKNRSLGEIETLTNNLLGIIRDLNFKYIERTFPVNASIGVITYHKSTNSASDILSAADAACYEAKEKGRNKIIRYSLGDETAYNQQEMNLVSQIYAALEENHFELFLQPIIDSNLTDSAEYNHFETLLRMPNPSIKGGMISPAIFITTAERYGLSEKVDYWVINNLFNKLTTEARFYHALRTISINLSIASLVSVEMRHKIANLFLYYKIDYHKICFEITETGVSSQLEEAIKFIAFFKKLGVSFSLDDFGTGMSSFSYLSELDVDFLKIDGSFVSQMEDNLIKQEMVFAMARIGKTLNKKVVAEYVETENTVKLLQGMKVEFLQGYYFSQPKPIQYFIDQI